MNIFIILLFSHTVLSQGFDRDKHRDLGSNCSLQNGQSGKCMFIDECPEALELIKTGKKPEHCGFVKSTPIVCCVKLSSKIKDREYGAIAKSKCQEIKLLHVPKFLSYVIGGTRASAADFIHMTALGFGPKDNIKWYCGGSLISSRFILTAAHCTNSRDYGLVSWARLGTTDISKLDPKQNQQDFSIVKRIPHPDYKPPKTYNDIALVVLDRDVNYTPFVKPACLHDGVWPGRNSVDGFFAIGWGLVDVNGNQSDWLQKVQLELFSKEECVKSYGVTRRLTMGISDDQLCAGSRDGIKDTCNGDSGGPLQFKNFHPDGYRGYTVFGVTSFGKYCGLANTAGVYSRVYSYLTWIEDNVWPQTGVIETIENTNCTLHDGTQGFCVSILECPYIQQLLRKLINPTTCGPQTQTINVCCKKEETLPSNKATVQESPKNISVVRDEGIRKIVKSQTDLVKREIKVETSTDCTQSNGNKGECILINLCPEMQEALNEGIPIESCESDSGLITVCCKKKVVERENWIPPGITLNYSLLTKQGIAEEFGNQTVQLSRDCQQVNGTESECVPLNACEGMKNEESRNQGNPVTFCESNSSWTQQTINSTYGFIAKQKCEEIKNLYEPKRFGLVTAGVNAKTGDYKHMAALGYGPYNSIKWHCGGSLISNKFILTAAHCLRSRDFGLVNWVRLGTTDIVKMDPEQDQQDFLVVNRIYHPSYKPPNSYNDIALLELDREVLFTNFIAPACVFAGDELPPGNHLATGWGLLDAHGEQSDWLQEVSLEIFRKSECRKTYGTNKRKFSDGIIDSQFCAGSKVARKDTCSGDSGGPFQFPNLFNIGSYQGYTVFGVTSFGKLCGLANIPGVYTKVSFYVSWIEQHVWPQQK